MNSAAMVSWCCGASGILDSGARGSRDVPEQSKMRGGAPEKPGRCNPIW